MGARIIFKIVACFCLMLCSKHLAGQIRNKIDLQFKYLINNTISASDPTYINDEYGAELPAILGNLRNQNGYQGAILYSGSSFIFQPGLIFTHLTYSGSDELLLMYPDFQLKSNALGVTCKINFWKYGRTRITPYVRVSGSLAISKITYSEIIYPAVAKPENDDIEYQINLVAIPNNDSFMNSMFEGLLGVETRIRERFFLTTEIGLNLRNYPDFDAPSPQFIRESSLSFGLCYKLLKDKRFFLR